MDPKNPDGKALGRLLYDAGMLPTIYCKQDFSTNAGLYRKGQVFNPYPPRYTWDEFMTVWRGKVLTFKKPQT